MKNIFGSYKFWNGRFFKVGTSAMNSPVSPDFSRKRSNISKTVRFSAILTKFQDGRRPAWDFLRSTKENNIKVLGGVNWGCWGVVKFLSFLISLATCQINQDKAGSKDFLWCNMSGVVALKWRFSGDFSDFSDLFQKSQISRKRCVFQRF